MSRYTNTITTFTTRQDQNRLRNYSIEDLNMAIIENDEKTVIEVLSSETISINQTINRDPYRNTLLHTAIEMGNVKIIRKLIDLGADLSIKNKKGESCAERLSKSHLGEIVQYISDKETEKISELKRTVFEKDTRIRLLEDNVLKLENVNNRVVKEKQDFEQEVVQLRKRKAELEESNNVLRQATKKPKN